VVLFHQAVEQRFLGRAPHRLNLEGLELTERSEGYVVPVSTG
jgi:hypothetical protein